MILEFLSTPSARRATLEKLKNSPVYIISIHALREEGDEGLENDLAALEISIHALREEGDPRSLCSAAPPGYFYPRPPRGGRRSPPPHHQGAGGISIHALREEGDHSSSWWSASSWYFYPRPPRGGRPMISRQRRSPLQFLSTPSARRATSASVGLQVRT